LVRARCPEECDHEGAAADLDRQRVVGVDQERLAGGGRARVHGAGGQRREVGDVPVEGGARWATASHGRYESIISMPLTYRYSVWRYTNEIVRGV
jgi:hypothetical protein